MRITIETRIEIADQGTKERRIEVEMADRDISETVLLVRGLVATADGLTPDREYRVP
jgi:tellurite resistance protein